MSVANVQAFRKKVNADPKLQEVVRETIKNDLDGVIALGSKNGYTFSEADLEEVFGPAQRADLSDFELELVVGGVANNQALKNCG